MSAAAENARRAALAEGPRLPVVPLEAWPAALLEQLARVAPLTGGRPLHVFGTLAQHPALLEAWSPLGRHLALESSLAPRERELVILRVGWLSRAEYPLGHHVGLARRAGLSDAEIERVREGAQAPGWSAFDAVLLRAVDELHAGASLGQELWDALAARYDARQLLDLLFTVGQYLLVSLLTNALRLSLEEGFPRPLSDAR